MVLLKKFATDDLMSTGLAQNICESIADNAYKKPKTKILGCDECDECQYAIGTPKRF
jgi:hypothetical protein